MADDAATERRQRGTTENIGMLLLVPMAVAILILLGIAVGSIYWVQHRHISDDMRLNIYNIQRVFRIELDNDSQLIRGLIDFIEHDEDLRNAWLAKDRDELLRFAEPIFQEIRSKYRVTHFYFIDPDRTCYLRVHNPQRHGDRIDRFTMDDAFNRNQLGCGIELGPYGTFTLRVVKPWRINGKLVGYIELGEEIEHITPKLRDITGCEVLFAIEKTYLDRTKWAEGARMMARDDSWDRFEQHVVADCTDKQIVQMFGEVMARHQENRLQPLFEIETKDRRFYCGFAPLLDAGDRKVGEIVVMKDVSRAEASLQASVAILMAISTTVGGLLFTFFYFFIGSIQNRLAKGRQDLRDEIDERKQTAEKLNKSMTDLRQFNNLAVGRELRMAELKTQVNELLVELDRKPEYDSIEVGTEQGNCKE